MLRVVGVVNLPAAASLKTKGAVCWAVFVRVFPLEVDRAGSRKVLHNHSVRRAAAAHRWAGLQAVSSNHNRVVEAF